MASATGVPETRPSDTEETGFTGRETEPLLGRPGDATQEEGKSAFNNLVLGTGTVAQIGIWLLVILIWASVFTKPLILFSGHPLAQSFAVLVLVQSILSLQPTHTLEQKRVGQRIHIVLNVVALLSLIAGVTIIEYNKVKNHNPHFHSAHAYFGFITAVVLLLQYLVGFTMLVTPKLYGGEEKAKAIWKYHRLSGYFVLLLLLATINSATGTDYNKNVLKLKLWATLILSILVVIGVYPRIQKQKLGLGRPSLSL